MLDGNGRCDAEGASKRPNGHNYDNPYLARVAVDETRFPSFTGPDVDQMKGIVEAVKAKGWRGLCGWVCVLNPIYYKKTWTLEDKEAYWKMRMRESEQVGFCYWKVDWGNNDRDNSWRQRLSRYQEEVAPHLIVEHALMSEDHNPQWGCLDYSQTWRSYDVLNHKAQAQTLKRLKKAFGHTAAPGKGIVNCEDEPYIAAAFGLCNRRDAPSICGEPGQRKTRLLLPRV